MDTRLALLVDGDNISAAHAGRLLTTARRYGQADIKRVYMDASRPTGWNDTYGFRLIHAGTGKNAADVMLAIDAMEYCLTDGVEHFVIASSDGDFSHVALRLREKGVQVTGVGEAKAPPGFRAACTTFVEIGAPKNECAEEIAEPRQAPCDPLAPESELDRKIRQVIALRSKNGQGVPIVELSQQMYKAHGVKISTRQERTWRGYLGSRADLYDLDAKGPDAKVRFKPAGFA